MASLVITGCGYLGQALAAQGLERGMDVHALTRNPLAVDALRRSGIHAIEGDIASAAWHAAMPQSVDLVVNCVSSGGGGLEGYRRVYVEGQRSVAAFARQSGARCVIYTGSTSVYPQTGGVEVTEADVPAELPEASQILLEAERALLEAGLPARTAVLRLAGLYGPGRHHLLDQVRSGEPLAGSGHHRLNLIHRDDAVSAVFAVADSDRQGVFNVTDGNPDTKETVTAWIAQRLGVPRPIFDPARQPPRASRRSGDAGIPDRIVSNRKARELLGWHPRHPSFREGYAELM